MTNSAYRLRWIVFQVAVSCAWAALVLALRSRHTDTLPTEFVKAVALATGGALLHGILGVRMLRTEHSSSGATLSGIHGGLKTLALRYFTGVGFVFAGLHAFPSNRTDFVLAWSGLFLILTVSEMIVFITGVKRL
jgi:hypothetical protein